MTKSICTLLILFSSQLTWATDAIPHCILRHQELPIDNAGTLNLVQSTPNQYKTEEHVKGIITQIYANKNGHQHFAVQLGQSPRQGIEVVYNTVFGPLPALRPGMTVEACGEYINSKAPTMQYPASPMGAIIHWVHINPNQGADAHPSGFLVIDGKLCGQDASHAGHNGGGGG